MYVVLLCAVGVGGATMFGAVVGFLARGISHRASDAILAFAAGVSFASAVLGLVEPSIEYGGRLGIVWCIAGIFSGAAVVSLLERATPHIHKFLTPGTRSVPTDARVGKVLVFVMAMAIHNLPEGIAAGVGFGTGDVSSAVLIASGIALQNLPEGMVIIAPMISAGISPCRALLCALMTGLVEVIGTFIGYFAVSLSYAILPFALAFAGGTMLYVVSDEMIPETHSHGNEHAASYSLLCGFSLMLLMDFLLS